MVPILEGKGLSKYFGGLLALDQVNFQVNEGEIVGLIGPNGAGKTTLFNVVCGFHPVDSGEIFFEGKRISGLRPHKICARGIARTFQVPRSFRDMTLLDNIMVGALFGNGERRRIKEARERASQLLALGGFEDKADVPVACLTAIDARRLELVRAVAANPTIVLLDEVMAGLNPTEVTQAMSLVKSLRSEMGITVLMVEHIMKSVMGISDRVFVLANGKVIAEGSPQDICSDPIVVEAYLGEPHIETEREVVSC